MTTKPFPRLRRMRLIIERINQVHCLRRLTGRRTDHLHGRCRRLTQAYLTERDASLYS